MPKPIKDALAQYAEYQNPKSQVILEAVTVESADIKDSYSDWIDADSTVGWSVLREGGARPTAAIFTKVSLTVNNGNAITSLPGITAASVGVVLVEWDTSADSVLENLYSVEAKLDSDAGGSKEVANWGCQLFRVVRAGVSEFDQQEQWELEAISRNTIVPAGVGTNDVTFTFPDFDALIGQPPEILDLENVTQVTSARPATVIVISAFKSDGTAASNVAWLGDTGDTTETNNGHICTRYNLTEIDDQEGDQTLTKKNVSVPQAGLPWFNIKSGSYSQATIEFTGANAPTLAATPTKTVEFMLEDEEPGGATGQGYVRNNGSTTWVAYTDGQTVADLAGVSSTGPTYEMRYIATPSTSGLLAPTVRRMGVRELTREVVSDVARVGNPVYSLDPFSLKSSIPTLQLEITRDGLPDYRDYATELFSDNHAGSMEFRLHYGSTELDRQYWIDLDSFRLQNYESAGDVIAVDAVHPLALSKKTVPAGSTAGQNAIVFSGATDTVVTAYTNLLGDAGVPDRYRGTGIGAPVTDSTSYTLPKISKTISKPVSAKDEIDRLAFIEGGAIIPSGGRYKWKRIWTSTGGLANSPSEHFDNIAPISVSPNLDRRIVQYRVPYGYDSGLDEGNGGFGNAVFQESTAAVSKLGHAALEPAQELDEDTARWIVGSTYATAIAQRTVKAFRQGAVVVKFKSDHPRPWVELGDTVEVKTDRFVGRGVESDRALRGRLSVVGIVIEHDLQGTEFSVWVPEIEGAIPQSNTISIDYGTPSVHITSIRAEAVGENATGDQIYEQVITLKPNQDCKRIRFSMGVNGEYTVAKSTGGTTLYKERYFWTNFTGGEEFEHTLRNVAFDALATSTSATLKFRLQQTSTGTISDIEDADDGDLTSDKLTMRVRPYSQTTGGVVGDQRVLELAPLKRQTSSVEASDGTNTYWGGSLKVGSGITLGISTGGGPQLASFGGFTETVNSVTVGASDLYLVSSSAAARTVTLPSTTTFRRITVKKIDSSTNAVTVVPGAASQTVDGSTSGTTLGTQYDSVTVVNNSTESPMGWYIV